MHIHMPTHIHTHMYMDMHTSWQRETPMVTVFRVRPSYDKVMY